MSGWIRAEKELTDTIRFKRMVKAYRNALRGVTQCDITRDETLLLGALIRLWMYADSHIRDDNTLVITCDEIDELVGVEGFAKSLPAEWLVVLDTERVELPDFLEHNGTSARQRKNNAARQSKHRWKKKQLGVTRDVTHGNARNDARPDQTRLEETRPDTHERAPVPRGTNNRVEPTPDEIDQAFASIKANYPHFTGNQDWITAEHHFHIRVEEGETLEALQAGVTRYRTFVEAGGVSSPKFVTTPGKFFTGPSKPWTQAWTPPPTKADTRLAGNVSAAQEFMRRTESQ